MKTYIVTEKQIQELQNKCWFNARLDEWLKSLTLVPSLEDMVQSKMVQQKSTADIECLGNSPFQHRWIDDVKRIQTVLQTNGYNLALRDCAGLWEDYSDSMCAGWMCLPSEDRDLFKTLESYLP